MEEEEMFRKNDCGDDQEVEADRPEEAAGAEDDSGSDERPGPRVRVHGAGDLWGVVCTGGLEVVIHPTSPLFWCWSVLPKLLKEAIRKKNLLRFGHC